MKPRVKRRPDLSCGFFSAWTVRDAVQINSEPGNKITRGNWHLPLIPKQSELASFPSTIVYWPPLYSLTKTCGFCEPGVVTFSRRHLLFVCRRTTRRQLGKDWRGSRQLRMLTWFSVIWSLFQYLVIIDNFLVKKHIESTMLCYSLAKHARFASQGLWTFPDDIFNFSVGELVEDNWGKLTGFLSVKDVDLIQSNLKSVSILVTTYYFWGKNI